MNLASCASAEDSKLDEEAEEEEAVGQWKPKENTNFIQVYYEEEEAAAAAAA